MVDIYVRIVILSRIKQCPLLRPGDLCLAKPGGFAQRVKTCAECAALRLGGTTGLHGRIIRAERQVIALGLHSYRI